jgi:alkanesulfonate monooxygenase SsuD/methylene tetrahydromethanopterin reductase-like flavin-dependent oxidoreductase (luciferase family)
VNDLRYAIDIAPLGTLSDPRAILRLARAAEDSGWDGLSMWDSLGLSMGTSAADLFVTLAAIAAATSRLKLITSIVAVARRRPQLVIQAAASLDLLSEGRLILGLGAGEDQPDFEAFGETHERKARLARMDEGIAIIDAGLRGEQLEHAGEHLTATGASVGPRPLQQPRPPIWFGALKPGGLRRAARWEGWIAVALSEDGQSVELMPDGLAAGRERVRQERATASLDPETYDIAVLGSTAVGGPAPAEYQAAGATWWFESLSPMRGSLDELEAVVRAGPRR